ncbi:MAG: hypothetical protein ACEQSQ_06450 [Candidatus Paceibacteria bacterium]
MKRVFLILLLLVVSVYADDSFGDLYLVFEDWIQGNLGKLLALLGFLIWFVGFIVQSMSGNTLTGRFIFSVGTVPLIAGGIVGITNTFFNMGGSTFSIIP